MTGHHTAAEPPLTRGEADVLNRGKLAAVLGTYGGAWSITYSADPPVWFAVRRPTPTALHVIAAHDLDSLEEKLAGAGDGP